MIVGSVSENKNLEKRVAITPDIIKKYKSLGLEVNLIKYYASHIGISDEQYEKEGVKILSNEDEILKNSDVIVQITIFFEENLNKL